jgi:hypothetical protein
MSLAITMNGENRPDEPVEFEKWPAEVQDFRKESMVYTEIMIKFNKEKTKDGNI